MAQSVTVGKFLQDFFRMPDTSATCSALMELYEITIHKTAGLFATEETRRD